MDNNDRQAEPSLTQMLQALLVDCEEERYWERVHHDQKLVQRKEEQKIQLDLMKALVESKPQVPPRRQLPTNLFSESYHRQMIDSYLTTLNGR